MPKENQSNTKQLNNTYNQFGEYDLRERLKRGEAVIEFFVAYKRREFKLTQHIDSRDVPSCNTDKLLARMVLIFREKIKEII